MKLFFGNREKSGFVIRILFVCTLAALSCSRTEQSPALERQAREEVSPVIALYGFSRNNDWFRNKTETEILDILTSWGINAVFGVHDDRALSEVLRQSGIKIFAEFGVFVGDEYWSRFPESRPVTSEGRRLEKEEWYAGVNPSNEQVRKEKLADFQAMLESRQLDGIWLDFIRWPCHWEVVNPHLVFTGFDKATLYRFSKDTGIKLDSFDDPVGAARLLQDRYQVEWDRWRCDQITSWVAECRELIDSCSPNTKLGLFGVPWIRDYDNAIITIIGQDYASLGKYVDIFSPMVYHKMCGRPIAWIDEVASWMSQTTGKDVIPIIQTVNTPGLLSPGELGEATRSALDAPGSMGVIFFNLDGLDEQKSEAARKAVIR